MSLIVMLHKRDFCKYSYYFHFLAIIFRFICLTAHTIHVSSVSFFLKKSSWKLRKINISKNKFIVVIIITRKTQLKMEDNELRKKHQAIMDIVECHSNEKIIEFLKERNVICSVNPTCKSKKCTGMYWDLNVSWKKWSLINLVN